MLRKFFAVLFLSVFAISCGDDEEQNFDESFIDKDTLIEQNYIYEQYSIPLPIDLFKFLGENGCFQPDVMSNLSIKDRYYTQVQSAMNLGIYTADLAYCTIFENGQNAMAYSDAASYFANKLSIEDAYGRPFVERLERNVDNIDSIKIITNEAYTKACNYLDKKGVYNVLPFVIYGAWIESLYLIINSDSDDELIIETKQKIIDEYSVIGKIITYMYDVQIETSAYYYNAEMKVLISNLDELKELFEEYSKDKTEGNYKKIADRIDKLKKEMND
ncbi:MAG: hypothetical protein JXL97_16380 [Bacteroidales bacterium]|nr:hypothetical protein [Bacteroidales bacterium]